MRIDMISLTLLMVSFLLLDINDDSNERLIETRFRGAYEISFLQLCQTGAVSIYEMCLVLIHNYI